MSFRIKHSKVSVLLLFGVFLTLNLQTVSILGWQPKDTFPIKISHLFVMGTLMMTLIKDKFIMEVKEWASLLFYVYAIVISALAYAIYQHPNMMIVNYIFTLIVICVSYKFQNLRSEVILNTLQKAFLVILTFILVKNIIHYQVFIDFFKAPWGHPILPMIYGGGVNLESTWVALGSILFFSNKKKYYAIVSFSFLLAIIYSSRVGAILTILSVFFYLKSCYSSRKEVFWTIFLTFILGALLIVLFIDEIKALAFMIDRFSRFGGDNDGGTEGRMQMWVGILPALISNYFIGYGAGNSIFAITPFIKGTWGEDNIHLLYLQNFLEFGIVGGLLYLFVLGKYIYDHWNSNGVLKYCMYLYFIGCLIQFRGAEPIVWFLFGLSYIERENLIAING